MGEVVNAPCQTKNPMTKRGNVQRRITLQENFIV
jgi:hypothetical protein